MPIMSAAERIYETSVTTGLGEYTLAGAVTGFQPVSVISANNYGAFFITDDVNWEAVIGTYVAGPARLQRTTIKASSNGGAAVNWGAGTRKIRNGWPAWLSLPTLLSRSVAGSSNVTLTAAEQRAGSLTFTGLLTGSINVIVDETVWGWNIFNNTTGAFTLTVKTSGGSGVAVSQGARVALACDGTNVVVSGAAAADFASQIYTGFTTAGTSTAYTLTPSPAISAYTARTLFSVTFHVASGAAPTLAISGVATPPNLVRQISAGTYANIGVNEIPTGHVSDVVLLSASQALVCDMPPAAAVVVVSTGVNRTIMIPTTVTVTIATPGVVTWTAHGFDNGQAVVFSTTGALPTGLAVATTYYIVNKATNTFEVATTVGGASINTSGTQSGVHTGTPQWVAPTGVTTAFITGVAGGGGGGGVTASGAGVAKSSGSGGGGGAAFWIKVTTVAATAYTVTVGAGGTAGTTAGTNGGTGGTSSVGALLSLTGGGGGAGMTGAGIGAHGAAGNLLSNKGVNVAQSGGTPFHANVYSSGTRPVNATGAANGGAGGTGTENDGDAAAPERVAAAGAVGSSGAITIEW